MTLSASIILLSVLFSTISTFKISIDLPSPVKLWDTVSWPIAEHSTIEGKAWHCYSDIRMIRKTEGHLQPKDEKNYGLVIHNNGDFALGVIGENNRLNELEDKIEIVVIKKGIDYWEANGCSEKDISVQKVGIQSKYGSSTTKEIFTWFDDLSTRKINFTRVLQNGDSYALEKSKQAPEFSDNELFHFWYTFSIACIDQGEVSVILESDPNFPNLRASKNTLISTISCEPRKIITKKIRMNGISLYSREKVLIENHSLGKIKVLSTCSMEPYYESFTLSSPLVKRNDFMGNIKTTDMGKIIAAYRRPGLDSQESFVSNSSALLISLLCLFGLAILIVVVRIIVVRSTEDHIPEELIPELLEKETLKRKCGSDFGKFSDGS